MISTKKHSMSPSSYLFSASIPYGEKNVEVIYFKFPIIDLTKLKNIKFKFSKISDQEDVFYTVPNKGKIAYKKMVVRTKKSNGKIIINKSLFFIVRKDDFKTKDFFEVIKKMLGAKPIENESVVSNKTIIETTNYLSKKYEDLNKIYDYENNSFKSIDKCIEYFRKKEQNVKCRIFDFMEQVILARAEINAAEICVLISNRIKTSKLSFYLVYELMLLFAREKSSGQEYSVVNCNDFRERYLPTMLTIDFILYKDKKNWKDLINAVDTILPNLIHY